MWSSTNTALANREPVGREFNGRVARVSKLRHSRPFVHVAALLCLLSVCAAQKIQAPTSVTAGEDATISTIGSGTATFYLFGPGVASKQDVRLGADIHLAAKDLQNAGAYTAVICGDPCRSTNIYVVASKTSGLTFLVHPSRVPVGQTDAVSGVAFPFDQFHNLVLAPVSVDFQLTAGASSLMSRAIHSENGVAWFRTASGKSAGPLQVVATVGALRAARAVQQVAFEPCNLRIKGQRTSKGIMVETEPVKDCAGNPLPDGTIVTFSASDANGKSTVDAPVKQGVARAQLEASDSMIVSAASGVVTGNELRIGARP